MASSKIPCSPSKTPCLQNKYVKNTVETWLAFLYGYGGGEAAAVFAREKASQNNKRKKMVKVPLLLRARALLLSFSLVLPILECPDCLCP